MATGCNNKMYEHFLSSYIVGARLISWWNWFIGS